MKTARIAFLLLAAIGCDAAKPDQALTLSLLEAPETLVYETHPLVEKRRALPAINGETTPIVWNGKVVTITTGLYFMDLETGAIIGSYPVIHHDFALTSAIVHNGRLYVFGSDRFQLDGRYSTQPGNSVQMISSADLVTWTAPVEVLRAPDNIRILNTSVAPDASGFVMVMEFNTDQEWGTYHEMFARSPDLTSWAFTGGVLEPSRYSSCPSIRYMPDGFYYAIHDLQYSRAQAAFVSRSKDLISWERQHGNYVVVSPKNAPAFEWKDATNSFTPGPRIAPDNNSDVDLVEFNGETVIVYNYGDQSTFGGQAVAMYSGTMQNFFQEFFK